MKNEYEPNPLFQLMDKPPANLVFFNDKNEEVGRLEFEGDKMKFIGKADEAAKVFFNYLIKNLCDSYLSRKG